MKNIVFSPNLSCLILSPHLPKRLNIKSLTDSAWTSPTPSLVWAFNDPKVWEGIVSLFGFDPDEAGFVEEELGFRKWTIGIPLSFDMYENHQFWD